ncbi:hypothetical protein GCM10023166_26910 [Paeniglutamicibacter cryotolerans]
MGLAEAARKCGVSVSTLRRRKDALVDAGATVSDKGWQIPIPALVSLGFLGSTTPPPDAPVTTAVQPATTPPADIPRDTSLVELESLRARLADAERRAEVAEAVATERERTIQVQAVALRMLEVGTPAPMAGGPPGTPGNGTPSSTPDIPVEPSEGHTRPARGWFRRRRG